MLFPRTFQGEHTVKCFFTISLVLLAATCWRFLLLFLVRVGLSIRGCCPPTYAPTTAPTASTYASASSLVASDGTYFCPSLCCGYRGRLDGSIDIICQPQCVLKLFTSQALSSNCCLDYLRQLHSPDSCHCLDSTTSCRERWLARAHLVSYFFS